MKHKYTLEKYNGHNRYTCPQCRKSRQFSHYVDEETGEYLAENVGKCNRENNCGYHYTPKQHFSDTKIPQTNTKNCFLQTPKRTQTPKSISFISADVLERTLQRDKTILQRAETNYFIHFLVHKFGVQIANELCEHYYIGTAKDNRTVFWQIDINEKIRAGKLMLYNPKTGNRNKKHHINWAHSKLNLPNYNLQQCFFGEHLLNLGNQKHKSIAIVESEKTAIIASFYFQDFVWLACGGLSNLNATKCEVLQNRNVVLFPDLGGYDKWNAKANQFGFSCSDLLEREACDEDKKEGYDIVDYLIQLNTISL